MKTKEQDRELVVNSEQCSESSQLHVLLSQWYLLIPLAEVEGIEVFCLFQPLYQVISLGHWIWVELADAVKLAEVQK